MKKYTEMDLEKLYDNNVDELAQIFKIIYSDEKIISLFKKIDKKTIIAMALKINTQYIKENNYHIPENYNIPEADFLKEDRQEIYNLMDYDIRKDIGETLQVIYDSESDKYEIYIHRTCNFTEKMFEEGIIYNENSSLDINDHFQKFSNFPFMLREIKYCNSYKGSKGCLIAKIPKNATKKDSDMNFTPLFYSKNNKTYLRPEFICAYVPVINEEINDVIFRNNIVKYSPDTQFYYDESVKLSA